MKEIIILAVTSIIAIVCLYIVLGRKTGHVQNLAPALNDTKPKAKTQEKDTQEKSLLDEEIVAVDAKIAAGLRAISNIDHSFTTQRFINGARSAYQDILEAYWKGELAPLEQQATPEVIRDFDAEVASRKSKGHALDNRLVHINKVEILKALLDKGLGRITVRFTADIAAITRDKDGVAVEGAMSDAVTSVDEWVFVKMLKSKSPIWMLAGTQASA